MKNRLFGSLISVAMLFAGAAFGYNCDDGCGSQCRVTVGGITQTNPLCQASCQTWKHANCHGLNPVASACGEIGANAYIGASNTMFGRSVGKRRRHLTFEEKTILKDLYGEEVLTKTELHFGVQPMDKIGGGSVQISPGSVAQTYGYNVYIKNPNADAVVNSTWIELLAHEMKHVNQFVNRGRSLNRFGRDYFEGYCNSGLNYNKIPMEKEAFGIEDDARAELTQFRNRGGLLSTDKRHALTCISNKTNFEVKYQAHWADGSWTSYTVAPNAWRSHYHNYVYANENRSPKFYVRFDYALKVDGSQWKEYVINQFASPHTDCNRQSQHEEFKYTNDRKEINLYRNY